MSLTILRSMVESLARIVTSVSVMMLRIFDTLGTACILESHVPHAHLLPGYISTLPNDYRRIGIVTSSGRA